MLASFDPVALDQACVDLCNKLKPFESTELSALEHSEKIGLGTRKYELINC